MKIKNRLSLYFTLIGSGVLLVVLVTIYFSYYSFLRADFFVHLKDRANVAAQLYLKADEISPDSLSHVRERYLKSLPGEVVRFYDSRNSAAFIRDDEQYWSSKIIEAVRRRGYLAYIDGERQVVGMYYKDNQGNFVILVSASDTDSFHRLYDMLETMVMVFFFVGASLFFISRWLAKEALSPISKLVDQMQLVKATNLSLRVEEGNGKDEISELARNFNRLLAHLENAFELQKTYVANASHELRTPITSIIGEVELALSKKRSLAENEETLKLVLEESERLKDTITGLMELAQVDMDYTNAELTPVRMDELLWEAHEYWTHKLGAGKLKVSILLLPENEAWLTIHANKQLMLIAFNNLIGNAFKFSDQQPVTCTFYADEQLIRMQIIDSGIGIPEGDKEHVFRSFYRGDNARTFAGNGIGLYITQKIIELFRGSIKVESVEGEGTTLSIEFDTK